MFSISIASKIWLYKICKSLQFVQFTVYTLCQLFGIGHVHRLEVYGNRMDCHLDCSFLVLLTTQSALDCSHI